MLPALALALASAAAPAQERAPGPDVQKKLFEAYLALDEGPASLAERRRILGEVAKVPVTPASATGHQKSIQKLWAKGAELEKDSGQRYFWEEEKKGIFIVGGETKKPKALAVCMHGGGVGEGDAWSAHGGYDAALSSLKWLALYPQVLEKTERGWTDAGTEEWVLELAERARRTWGIDPDRVYLVGHSMGGYGSWLLGAHHADAIAAIAPSAGAPTPYVDAAGNVTGILSGIVPNLRNVTVRIYQSDDDPRVPPGANRAAAKELEQAKARWGGFDFEYWEVPSRQHDFPPGGPEAHLAKIAEVERTTHPAKIVWQPTLDWRWQSYWLFWDEPVKDALVVAEADRKTNTVRVSCDKSTRGLYVLVDERLLDPKKEIVVLLGDKEVYRGVPQPDLATILATGSRGDPDLAYTTRIPLF
jgi:poly(3-hydroxybutyrate) depolymerase